jgi:hypothetical protein
MKTVRGLVPLALVIAAVAALTWYLLDQDMAAGAWLLAALLFAHGWVHLVFVFPRPDPAAATAGGPPWPFDMNASWVIRRAGLDARIVRAVCRVLMAVAFIAFLLAALATVGILVPVGWWAGLVLAGSIASLALLAICYSHQLLLGFAIDLVLIVLVAAGAWGPTG